MIADCIQDKLIMKVALISHENNVETIRTPDLLISGSAISPLWTKATMFVAISISKTESLTTTVSEIIGNEGLEMGKKHKLSLIPEFC